MTAAISLVAPPRRLARRMACMSASAVREILKIAERPDVLSFAGGLPAPELFPIEAIAQAHVEVLASAGGEALQYSTTEGFGPLREWVCARLAKRGIRVSVEQVLITNGSQQGIDLVGRALIDPGDAVAVENPSYLAALQSFSGCEASLVPVGSDEDGMRVDELERAAHDRPLRMIYCVPEFHNPKGTTLSLERRQSLVRLSRDLGIPILEDDPYGELRFRGQAAPPLAALDGCENVVYLGTFSKTLAPGLRIGWLAGPRDLVRSATILKQAADLHTATLAQRATFALLSKFDYDAHLDRLRVSYAERCDAMLASLARHIPGVRCAVPDGGLFLWAQLPRGLRGDDLLRDAVAEKVAFVPGAAFFAAEPRHDFVRLNFSNRPPDLIEEGIARLGKAVRARLAARTEGVG